MPVTFARCALTPFYTRHLSRVDERHGVLISLEEHALERGIYYHSNTNCMHHKTTHIMSCLFLQIEI